MRSKFKWIFTLLLALTVQFSFAQEKTITGLVSDANGPLPGVNVVVKGTQRSVSTGFDGSYSIKAKEGETLVYSFMGMRDVSKIVGASNVINTILQDDSKQLSEVVVQGYRTVTKKTAVTAAASVNSKTIENRPNANVMNTLQGQLAGVNITAATGQPGAKSSVIIRGLGTITGNSDPLYVIDGFPSNSDNFRSINPNDIASVDVLKDASAIAEYGSRGANGVIVIKTKKGSYGNAKTVFRYSSQFGTSQLQTPKYDYASSKQLLTLEKIYGVGRGSTLTDAQIAAYDVNTNWVDYFFRTAPATTHNLSIENSGNNLNSFTSLGYTEQDGILKTTGLKRFTIRNNMNGKSSNDKFKYYINSAFGYSKNNEATNLGEGAINRNYVLGAYASVPYVSPNQYVSGLDTFNLYQADGTLLYTPLMLIDKLNNYANKTDEARFDLATEASYKIFKDLTGRVRTSGQLLSTRFHQAEFPQSFNAYLFQASGQTFIGFEDINQRREFLFNNLWQLDYNKVLDKHTFNVAVNAEYNYSTLHTNNFRQRGLDPKTFVPDTGSGYAADTGTNDFYVPQISASQLRNDLISYFGSFDYDYNKKYGFVASARRDWSSRFIGNRQAGTFWSLGGRWNIDEESFMDNVSFIDVLKLRGSIGTVGNQRIVDGTIFAGINPPAFTDVYSNANNAYNGVPGYNIAFGYPELRWETTKQYNAGLDFELSKGRVRGALDYYNKKTIDLFLQEPVSPTSGTTVITKNSDAYIVNKGFELNLAYDLVRNTNGLTVTLRANGSVNDNEVGGIKANGGRILTGTGPSYVSQNGGMILEPFVYHYIGVNPANGNLLFEDINGNPTENPTGADRKASGKNYLPKYQGGFGFDLDYKGFFASTTFTFAKDVWRFDSDLENLYDPTNLGQFTVGSVLLDAWTPANTDSNVPSLTAGNLGFAADSDRFLRDASYIRLRNAQVGYRVPKKFLDKTFVTDLSFTLQGENLVNFTKWQGFDPESTRTLDNYRYPTPRIVTFGLDLKF